MRIQGNMIMQGMRHRRADLRMSNTIPIGLSDSHCEQKHFMGGADV
jgi:hypothetical protein